MDLRNLKSVFIIAEIGQNHQGDIRKAKEMILEASRAGVDCVKFQKSCLPAKFTQSALTRPYSSPNAFGTTYGEHKRHLEFTIEQFRELKDYAESCGLVFSASAMDSVSFDELMQLDLRFIKIGSGDTNNIPMMRYIAGKQVPLIVSTGMQTDATVNKVHEILSNGGANFALLHCVSSYPTSVEDTMLNYIAQYRESFPNTSVGYSGHEQGIECSCLAVLMGARILERHFTLDKSQKGSDHCLSLDASELRSLVERVRLIERNVSGAVPYDSLARTVTELSLFEDPKGFVEKACRPLDNSPKSIFPCELPCKHKLGKSLVYARDVTGGRRLDATDIAVKVSEPMGVPAEFFDDVVGRAVKRDVLCDEPVMKCDID